MRNFLKIQIILIVVFGNIYILNAIDIDSLKLLIKNEKETSSKIELLNKFSQNVQHIDYVEALEYANEALILSKETGNYNGIVNSLIQIGEVNFFAKREFEALKNYLKAIEYASAVTKKEVLAYSYLRLAYYFLYHENLDLALNYNDRAFDLLKKGKDLNSLSYSYMIYSYCYFEKKDFVKLKEWNSKLLVLFNSTENKGNYFLKYSYNCFAQSSWAAKDYDKALHYFDLYLNASIADKDSVNIANAYNGKGSVYYYKRLNNEAIKSFEKAIQLNQYNISDSYTELVFCYLNNNQIINAERYFVLSKSIINTDLSDLKKACDSLIFSCKKTRNISKSNYYIELRKQIADSIILNQDKSKQLIELVALKAIEESAQSEVNAYILKERNTALNDTIKAKDQRNFFAFGFILIVAIFIANIVYNKRMNQLAVKNTIENDIYDHLRDDYKEDEG